MINPIRMLSSSTTGSFSILYRCRISWACFRLVPTGAVIRFSLVMISLTERLNRSSNLRSLLVRIPISLLFSSITGIPPILYVFMRLRASWSVASAVTVTGSMIIPLSERFTFLTWSAWSSMDIFLCTIPIPPSRAIAIASLYSVTVSMAADTIGTFIDNSLVSWDRIETSRGRTSEYAGTKSTSSNVSASVMGGSILFSISIRKATYSTIYWVLIANNICIIVLGLT